MKVKLSTIQSAQSAFNAILSTAMPIKLSYAISKNLKKITSEFEDIEKMRLNLVTKYGKEDGKGGIQVTPENTEVFSKEFTEFLAQEIEMDLWKLSLNQLVNAGVRLSPNQVMSLEDFIEYDLPTDPVPQAVPVVK